MRGRILRLVTVAMAFILPLPQPWLLSPLPAQAQTAASANEPTAFNSEQLDALLAPIALYPDPLLTQILMACTYPVEIVEASRWLGQGNNAQLHGDALTEALQSQNWDPSVKSLVPFPQVLSMLNNDLSWTQQVGYAFATQQADVMNSIQRLRAQAQQAGTLQSTAQQTVTSDQGAIVIQPANPQVVYVPVFNPSVVYGAWPYPALPPVYFPPPPGYVAANAFVSGLAFAAGVAVVGSLWGWARPVWGGGTVNVNVNHWNSINVNRTAIHSNVWRPPPPGVGGRPLRPPGGPVGTPARLNGLPPNAIGRSSVQVPSSLVSRPPPGNGVPPANRQGPQLNRPGGQPPSPASNRPVTGQGASTFHPPSPPRTPPQNVPQNVPRPTAPRYTPPTGAFGGVNEGTRAAQYGNRGAQSRNFQQQGRFGGGGGRGGFYRR